ncbi:MAG TPA: HAMP domain-containing sensor histidine kinase [Vicinamibacteria bacterium]|nr:HAMP domain-containing sensor histidine kinase [Vicinamibacteria bacterium]
MSSRPAERLRAAFGLGLGLASWYAALFALGTLGLFGLSYVLLARSLEQRDREAVRLTLATYASEYETSGPAGLWRTLAAQEALGAHVDLFVRAIDRDGAMAFLSLPGRWSAFDLGRPVPAPPAGTYAWERLEAAHGDEVLELATLPLADGALLQVGRSSRAREEVLQRFRALLGVVLGATVLVGLAGGALLTRRALRPLRDLASTLEGIVSTGRLEARVPSRESGGDALDALVRLVNALLERIESLVAAMRGSLDAVAHDLRTPLMRLRVSASRALADEADAETRREALADCLEEADRVRDMLDSLMDISEAEAGVMALHLESVEVARLFDEVKDLFGDVAEEKGVALRVQPPGALALRADRTRALQALANLVDNAVKFTPGGGEVSLAARPEGAAVALTVADTGIGIPREDLPHVWERLFRGDRSRSERGLGLGLSLVRAIARAHGGEVAVDSAPGQGSRFTLLLPAERA